MKFLVDAQLPPALAVWLREAGHDAQAVRELGLREAEDAQIWYHALKTGAVLITKDEDFPARAQQTEPAPVVVWLRIGNSPNRALRQWFLPQLPSPRLDRAGRSGFGSPVIQGGTRATPNTGPRHYSTLG